MRLRPGEKPGIFDNHRDAFKFLGLILIVAGVCGALMFLVVLFLLTLVGVV